MCVIGFTVNPSGRRTNLAAERFSHRNPKFIPTLAWSYLKIPCVAKLAQIFLLSDLSVETEV